MNREELERLDREALIARAQEAGVSRARILTRPELVDELLLRGAADEATREQSRGLFGRARDLLARVVDRGLHLPEAAERIRSLGAPVVNRPSAPAALPTVTLAEIYAAQGHRARALETLERVLVREPEHAAARALLAQLSALGYPVVAPRLPPEQDDASADRAGDASPAEAPATAADGARPPAPAPAAQPDGADRSVEPMRLLDDVPRPARYDIDECIAIQIDPTVLYVYWEARETTLEYLRAAHPRARLTVRVVTVVPTWEGPRSKMRDYEAARELGELVADGLPNGSLVRAAIGLRDGDVFLPIAHAAALEPPAGAPRSMGARGAFSLRRSRIGIAGVHSGC